MVLRGFRRFSSQAPQALSWDSWIELVRRCKTLEEGKSLHAAIPSIASNKSANVFLHNLLIQMYSRCGSLDDAMAVFDSLLCPNSFSWTITISALAQHGNHTSAIHFYRSMLLSGAVADEVTLVAVLDACEDLHTGNAIFASVSGEPRIIAHTKVRNAALTMYGRCGDLAMACAIFKEIPAKDAISWNSMITAYARNGHLEEAEKIFDSMPVANVVSWTAMIAGNAQHGRSAQAFQFFRRMILQGDPNSRPNQVTLLAILDACLSLTSKSAIATVRGLEALAAESMFHGDVMVNSALVNVYGSLGSVPDARRIFQSMPDRNVVSWSSMVAARAKCQRSGEAMATMRAMELEGIKASSVTLLAAIEACESSEDAGRIHARIVRDGFEGDTKLGNALVGLYGLKLGMIDRAREVFDRIQRKDAVSWGVAIDAWAASGFPRESLVIFARMDLEGVLVEEVSFTLAIDACAAIPSLERGRMLHREMVEGDRCGVEEDLRLGNSLINMYVKCGSIPDARAVFDSMPERDVISWTAMLTAYIESEEAALEIFQGMKLEGILPNQITFLNLLATCSHAGMLQDGHQNFQSMIVDFSIPASPDHYICMIDLLARCGRLEEAENLIDEMPYEPDPVAWTTLLGGSRIHGDRSRASESARSVWKFEAQARHPANYALLSHVYEEEP